MTTEQAQTFLIVDDCEEDRVSIKRFLHRCYNAEAETFESETGRDGLSLCTERLPSCVLLDYSMPDMNGIEFYIQLTANLTTRHIPVIMLTGQGTELIAVQAMKMGVQDYLVKEKLNGEVLAKSIEYALKQKHAEREQEKYVKALEQAAEQIKKLEQLLPICSHCKKIRDDSGYWQKVEDYFRTFSNIEFTHSICPACSRELYPELFDDDAG